MISFRVHADTKDIKALSRKLGGMRVVMREVGEILEDEIQRNFVYQGAVFQGGDFTEEGRGTTTRGKAWKPLAESTKKDRKRRGYSPARPILNRSGTLKRSFTIKGVGLDFVKVGTDISWAEHHQTGGKHLPQRKLIGLSKRAHSAILQRINNYFEKK